MRLTGLNQKASVDGLNFEVKVNKSPRVRFEDDVGEQKWQLEGITITDPNCPDICFFLKNSEGSQEVTMVQIQKTLSNIAKMKVDAIGVRSLHQIKRRTLPDSNPK